MAGTGGIGEYEVGAPIREGWGGTIREGQYRRTGRRVTVQEVRPDLTSSPGLIDRLGNVGRETASVRDPHLLAVYDLVDEAGSFRLIAEWCDGATVTATLRRGSMAPGQAIAAVSDVLAGLEALHARGLFHGQVGPETVVVDGEGRSRLAELALCAAATPQGFGPHTDVRDTARLGLHLLRTAGSRFDPVRRALDGAATAAGGVDAARLHAELDSAATAVLGPGWRDRSGRRTRRRRTDGRRGRGLLLVAVAAVVAAAVVAAVILLAGRGGGGTSSTGPLTLASDVRLVVTPATGGCNTTFSFVGRGSLTGTGTLVYRWEQSDGQVTADTSLPITSNEGAFQLTQAWRLQGSQKVDGTMTLHILKPVDRRISQTFHYSCP
jgi:hypothetical protein